MENLIQITSVPVIAALVYGVIELYKRIVSKEKFIKIIPIIAAVLGAVLGIVAYYAVPDIIAADNILTAILIGGASGLAATGTNQLFKQLIKGLKKKDDTDSDG